MQKAIECPVCTNMYAPNIRPPKVLTMCGHEVCEPCVRSLLSAGGGSSIVCPQCKIKCNIPEGKPEKLQTMDPLLELIDSLCDKCKDQPHTQDCEHCPLKLCDDCREAHACGVSSNLADKVRELKELMADISLSLADRTQIQAIREYEIRLNNDMNLSFEEKVRQLNAEHERKLAAVDADVERQTNLILEWRKNCTQFSAECEGLMKKVKSMESGEMPDVSIEEQERARQLLKRKVYALKRMVDAKPIVEIREPEDTDSPLGASYSGVSNETQTDSFKLVQQTQTDGIPPPPIAFIPDYSVSVVNAEFTKQMTWPMEVCVDPITGHIITTDLAQNAVYVLTSELQLVRRLCASDLGQKTFDYPSGVVAAGGSIYVSDECNHRIYVTNVNGEEVCSFGSDDSAGENFNPRGMFMDYSEKLYVCDSADKSVKIMDKSGTTIRAFGHDVLDEEPAFSAISVYGAVAVTTITGCNIYLFTPRGQHIRTIRTQVPPHNIHATGVTFDRHGNLLVSDKAGGRVVVMRESGDVLEFIGSPGPGPGQLEWPQGLAVTRDGHVVVCDAGNEKVVLFGIQKKPV